MSSRLDPPTDPAIQLGKASAGRAGSVAVLLPVLAGCLVALGLGAYGRLHEPAFVAINIAGFSSGLAAKSWLASLVFVLALVQLWSAAVLYGKLRGPRWSGVLHRWSGRLAVLASAPIAVHCLYAYGFAFDSPRTLAHSVLGCFFYGAFVAKMLFLSRDSAPGWVLPVVGGAVFTGLTGLWLTSAVWFFSGQGLTF